MMQVLYRMYPSRTIVTGSDFYGNGLHPAGGHIINNDYQARKNRVLKRCV